jgi:hypothetical protein
MRLLSGMTEHFIRSSSGVVGFEWSGTSVPHPVHLARL